MMNNYQDIISVINNSNNIVIASHINPDCDTICSAMALRLALLKINKSVDIVCDGRMTGRLSGLDNIDIVNTKTVAGEYDLAIAVDCSSLDRLGDNQLIFMNKKIKTVTIDHHHTREPLANINVIKPYYIATTMLVFELINEIDVNILDRDIARMLYTGMITDSGLFSYNDVTPLTHTIASKLMEYDIDHSSICYNFFRKLDKKTFDLHNRVLSRVKFDLDNHFAYIVFNRQDFEDFGLDSNSTEGAINKLMDIDCVYIGASLTEVSGNSYKISLRSKEPYSSLAIAERVGGGGHIFASGCRLNGNIYSVVDNLTKLVAKEIE